MTYYLIKLRNVKSVSNTYLDLIEEKKRET